MVRKGGLEPPCLSAPPPQDGVSANFTTSALKNCFIVSYLPVQLVRGSCSCTGFCTDSTLPAHSAEAIACGQFRELEKELLNRIGLRVNIAHGRLNVIVTGYVLQRERVGAAACFGEKSVSQSVQTSVRVGLDPGPQRPHLGLQHPGSQRFLGTSRVAKHMIAF